MENTEKLLMYQNECTSGTKIWLLYLFLGWSYGSLGQMGKQILFYLTLGGLLIWGFFRFFTLNSAIKKYNLKIAHKHNLTYEQTVKLGLM